VGNQVNFYSINDEYGEFSNFASYPIKLKGKVCPTSEHYFQAMKFESANDQNEIRRSKSPIEAARKGRDRKRKLRKNWESVKDNVMREAVIQKFTQHPDLKETLLSTGTAKLGQILMEVREKLREE
jgi:ribA/ribD-fused uncharacterized protein